MNIQSYIDDYANWLKNEITFNKIGEYYEINTPFLDTDNDYLQFYVKQDHDELFFTDDGYTINSLETAGFKMSPSRKTQLLHIINQYGVQLCKKELTLKAPAKMFPQKKHAFTQCLIRVSDLYATTKHRATSYFLDDVQEFFQQKEIFCLENVQFIGKSGFTHNYDFAIQRSKHKPERLCMAINNPTKSTVGSVIFAWGDTKPARKADSQLVVLLNDPKPIKPEILDGFFNYDVNTINWSERNTDKNLDMLTA